MVSHDESFGELDELPPYPFCGHISQRLEGRCPRTVVLKRGCPRASLGELGGEHTHTSSPPLIN